MKGGTLYPKDRKVGVHVSISQSLLERTDRFIPNSEYGNRSLLISHLLEQFLPEESDQLKT